MNTNEAWEKLIEKYNIIDKIKKDGAFYITAKQIGEFKEPRLMAKWDSSEALPKVFKHNNINILPVSRGEYVLSDFKLYEPIPELGQRDVEMLQVERPMYDSIDIENITSESNAIHVLILSKILDDFLSEDDNVSTFSGRMSTGVFSFYVDRHRGTSLNVNVNKAQCEIDGGVENSNSVVILEAKNVVRSDFHIRQLYYPYRLWKNKVNKPIRLVFLIYSNQIYRLFEYRFTDIKNYSSIELVRTKNYSLQDTDISLLDLYNVYENTHVNYDDNMKKSNTPFIQANSFEKLISILEILCEESKTKDEISNIMQFDLRQAGYYFNAGKYLGLLKKILVKEEAEGKIRNFTKICLTSLGKEVMKLNYKERQLKLVSFILEHKIFRKLFFITYDGGKMPDKKEIIKIMKKNNVCGDGQIERRSSTVESWLKWIFSLPNI